jgi:hypothetical protein
MRRTRKSSLYGPGGGNLSRCLAAKENQRDAQARTSLYLPILTLFYTYVLGMVDFHVMVFNQTVFFGFKKGSAK